MERNAYVSKPSDEKQHNTHTQNASKVIFPEPYENMWQYYNKSEFCIPPKQEPPPQNNSRPPQAPMFNLQSLLPMLMGGKFNDILKPLMGMLGDGGGGGLGDVSKIFELFKPKSKEKSEKKEEDVSSKFDDMIIIED